MNSNYVTIMVFINFFPGSLQVLLQQQQAQGAAAA